MRPNSIPTFVLLLAGAALLSFLSRTFIDYHLVYAEVGIDSGGFAAVTVFNLAFYGAWIAALIAASHQKRRAVYVLLAYDLLLVLFGLFTMTTLCPSPCRAAWPVGEIAIWSNVVVGLAALAAAVTTLVRGRAGSPA